MKCSLLFQVWQVGTAWGWIKRLVGLSTRPDLSRARARPRAASRQPVEASGMHPEVQRQYQPRSFVLMLICVGQVCVVIVAYCLIVSMCAVLGCGLSCVILYCFLLCCVLCSVMLVVVVLCCVLLCCVLFCCGVAFFVVSSYM